MPRYKLSSKKLGVNTNGKNCKSVDRPINNKFPLYLGNIEYTHPTLEPVTYFMRESTRTVDTKINPVSTKVFMLRSSNSCGSGRGFRASLLYRSKMSDKTYKIVMLRHGESIYNKENRFCGWFDADLSGLGNVEAESAGKILKEKGFTFDIAFTSLLKRSIKTLFHVQDVLDLHWIPVVKHWRLNERMYGALQGLNKSETAQKHGEEQVKLVDKQLIPKAECLKDTVERVLPFWYDVIVPEIKNGKRVLIAAHGNSLRALVKYLDKMSDDEIMGLNIPTGIPLVYELDENLKPLKHYYLASQKEIDEAMSKVAAQGQAKK